MSEHVVTYTAEGGGHVATCSCAWLRWERDRSALEGAVSKHLPRPERRD